MNTFCNLLAIFFATSWIQMLFFIRLTSTIFFSQFFSIVQKLMITTFSSVTLNYIWFAMILALPWLKKTLLTIKFVNALITVSDESLYVIKRSSILLIVISWSISLVLVPCILISLLDYLNIVLSHSFHLNNLSSPKFTPQLAYYFFLILQLLPVITYIK